MSTSPAGCPSRGPGLGLGGRDRFPTRDSPAYVQPDFAGWAHTVVPPHPFSPSPSPSSSRGYGSVILGPYGSASASSLVRRCLVDRHVTAIVNCTLDAPCHHDDVVEYCRVPVRDEFGADILPYLWGATAFVEAHLSGRRRRRRERTKRKRDDDEVEEADDSGKGEEKSVDGDKEGESGGVGEGGGGGGSVLVHCEMGVSRSATVVVAYLIRFRGMSLDVALESVRRRRPQARPNPGFMRQLAVFEKAVRRENGETGDGDGDGGNAASARPPFSLSFPFDDDEGGDDGGMDPGLEWARRSSAAYSTAPAGSRLRESGDVKSNDCSEDVRRHIAEFEGGEDAFTGACFGDLSFLLREEDTKSDGGRRSMESPQLWRVLNAAMDYVWSRGVLEIDLRWLEGLCRAIRETLKGGRAGIATAAAEKEKEGLESDRGADSEGSAVKEGEEVSIGEMIRSMLRDGSSDFRDRWCGEIYPEQVDRMMRLLDGMEAGEGRRVSSGEGKGGSVKN